MAKSKPRKKTISQPEDKAICPRCGKVCIQLEKWSNDFLAIHKIKSVPVSGKFLTSIKTVYGCDNLGEIPR